ncbi:hypothetical protein LWM68_02190 [Niabella sp. W65]|nr:hypothetical protein [Niabella sp. W65]MCH7361695.1 hypothetical protein [Niabella sp. W65]
MVELDQISGRNVPVCYFLHSSEALKHSESLGLTPIKKALRKAPWVYII